ncbi:hypothetical protein KJ819_01445 [Patescibacteria group bacterium]|nr:hypothetical protein [Patescibacteria group bacterium]MBU1501052.1 hypothetical protein [Patescibacteria group bacterium]MBU2081075.1 hypothetical protein [Patescibacteria group bacterium]MBU2124167.1 hypothetical protein [Patescibacteria group bacterium]MBU2195023.1 hypothetical protein [Patescibacteria group bacterium]
MFGEGMFKPKQKSADVVDFKPKGLMQDPETGQVIGYASSQKEAEELLGQATEDKKEAA